MIKLDSVGALELFATESSETHPNDSEDEVDSDYSGEDDNDSTFSAESDEDEAEDYFLDSDDYRNYGDPSDGYLPINDSLAGTTVLKFMPLGVI